MRRGSDKVSALLSTPIKLHALLGSVGNDSRGKDGPADSATGKGPPQIAASPLPKVGNFD
jgi:hypothetical protein